MWGRKRQSSGRGRAERAAPPQRLKDALRKARVDQAERTGVVVDLHDAEVARLECLNEALDPLFAEIPAEVDLFDRGISRGETPRLWIDASPMSSWAATSASTASCRTPATAARCSPRSVNIPEMVDAVTKYLAQRLIERERALAGNTMPLIAIQDRGQAASAGAAAGARSAAFLFGLLVGARDADRGRAASSAPRALAARSEPAKSSQRLVSTT